MLATLPSLVSQLSTTGWRPGISRVWAGDGLSEVGGVGLVNWSSVPTRPARHLGLELCVCSFSPQSGSEVRSAPKAPPGLPQAPYAPLASGCTPQVGGGRLDLSPLRSPAGPEDSTDLRQINRRKACRFLPVHGGPTGKRRPRNVAEPKCLYTRLDEERKLWKRNENIWGGYRRRVSSTRSVCTPSSLA